MNAIIPASQAQSQSVGLVPQNLDQAMRLAEMMARGKLVPEHLRNPSDALMVVELAMRFGMSPFAVAQATSVIQGKLMLEGKLVSAAVHSSGILSGRLAYVFAGEGATRRITVSGTIRGEAIARTIDVELKDAKTTNGMWVKQPDQQLVYFATRAWARRHVPEVMLGVYSPEEFDAPPPPPFKGATLDHRPEPAAASDAAPAPVPPETPRQRGPGDWLADMALVLANTPDLAAFDKILARPAVKQTALALKGGDLDEWKALLADNVARLNQPVDHDPATGEVAADDLDDQIPF